MEETTETRDSCNLKHSRSTFKCQLILRLRDVNEAHTSQDVIVYVLIVRQDTQQSLQDFELDVNRLIGYTRECLQDWR